MKKEQWNELGEGDVLRSTDGVSLVIVEKHHGDMIKVREFVTFISTPGKWNKVGHLETKLIEEDEG